tara:strand:- start:200 stop:661 length:462 start_codon:yes stop_codon:yes gene_type:complete
MKPFSLNLDEILKYQQNRYPFLMIDYVDEVLPGSYANGYKMLKEDEWFFKVHWPGDPNMPGLLQVEALVQMCALTILTLEGNLGKIVYLSTVENVKLIKKVIPNDKFSIKTKLVNFKRGIGIGEGEAYIGENLACKARFSMVLPSELNKFKIK